MGEDAGMVLNGVIFDFLSALRAGWAMSPENFPDPFKWEIWECWGMDKSDFLQQANELYEQHLFFKGKPYPGAIEALHELNALGHTVHIVTARHHPVARRDTVAWLREQAPSWGADPAQIFLWGHSSGKNLKRQEDHHE